MKIVVRLEVAVILSTHSKSNLIKSPTRLVFILKNHLSFLGSFFLFSRVTYARWGFNDLETLHVTTAPMPFFKREGELKFDFFCEKKLRKNCSCRAETSSKHFLMIETFDSNYLINYIMRSALKLIFHWLQKPFKFTSGLNFMK